MHLILTGATGLVGSAVLDAMIKMPEVTRISVLSRRPVKMMEATKDKRVNLIIHEDFMKYDGSLLGQLADAEGCVWALGISQSQVGKEEYIKITKDYALAAAEAFQNLPAVASPADKKPFHFVYVSGEGATHKPGMLTPIFGRVKGETELRLAEMRRANPYFRSSSPRPAIVDAANHPAIQPYIPALGFARSALGTALTPFMRVYKAACSPTEKLGPFLTEMALGRWDGDEFVGKGYERLPGGFPILENTGMRRLGEW
ncbi:nucleoside-diphosphate-sugar epimerase [Lasiosphaeria miniovina]|uniref:Nucleoside-diphosphate-sugar epimerase n=1 Tax=Lasiosphaeria miniovina TaxID=1954250 RepID=A0AA40E5P7_9PEZI|nr:nucleoside-diphosphate-sugar epimerase [Lasiosphaeria miniovina]KAK0723423.1 nucleoside-diphosphate-sugar epimerase [Lasiosphaeria miniovina]